MSLDFDVRSFEPTPHPESGDRAPEFVRPLVNVEYWEDVALSDLLASGPVLLVFHPMVGAFPAIYVWNELRDRGWDEPRDVEIVGVSISSPYAIKRFIEDRGIEY